ncbi:hypothetical protein Bb109J_c0930 [Bdellovibrio bacteriovorus]|uniref:DUF4340 domain-containing protein n=1 Tax=Bdellovibrio bacteriovorus TaxID=959 RepID=UPI00045BF045|nr:DUF4340 domain-containing protein [Bdellovibrio bacteriovorus]AHZ86273.1 hypothetical protein EP01_15220 [Bdellovibrio bacteriovorus]BEV67510.1 hypothetical protein Bb109J_c0930 [Bdellovibrio bacteriovorus]
MKLKGRTILVICLLVFGGYAVYDFFHEKKMEEKRSMDARLMTVNFEQVDWVQVEKGDQKITLKRSVDGWNMEEPFKDQADNTAVDDFVKGAFPERIIETAAEGENINWAVYGLDKPAGKVTFKTTAGTQNVFEISEKRNFEDNVFARRDGENKVLVVNSIWQNRVNKGVMDFRERRFLRHKIASVDEVRLKNQMGTFEIRRVEGQWVAPAQKDLKLDQNKVREFLTSIADAKASEIVEAKLPALKNLFVMDLTMADKKWKAEVGQAQDLGIYAKVSEPAQQLKMEPGALDRFIKATLADLREVSEPKQPKKSEAEESQAMMAEQKEK